MLLCLMQHGVCLPEEVNPEQPLSPVGREQIEKSAAAVRRLGLKFDAVLSSTRKRAFQTAELVAQAVGFPASRIVQSDALKANVPAERCLEFLLGFEKKSSLFVAGHLPSLHNLACLLLASGPGLTLRFENGGLACLDVHSLRTRTAALAFLLTPRQLALIAET